MSGALQIPAEHFEELAAIKLRMFTAIRKINEVTRKDPVAYLLNLKLAEKEFKRAKRQTDLHYEAIAVSSRHLLTVKNEAREESHDKLAAKARQMWVDALGQLQMAQAAHNIVVMLLNK